MIARLYPGQPVARVAKAVRLGRTLPLTPAPDLNLSDLSNIVALPLARGDAAAGAGHDAKIAECGAPCSTKPTSGVITLDVDADGFTVEPLAETAACTPHSVGAHMLYENSDPFHIYEPGGHLDLTGARVPGAEVARIYQVPEQLLERFHIRDLRGVKFSLPRPVVQGPAADRDMHGAQYAALPEEHEHG